MIRTPGNIKLPLQQVVQVGQRDIQALDFLFDMKVPGLNGILQDEAENQIPGLMLVFCSEFRFITLIFFLPPEGIRLFPEQKYLIYAARDILMLTEYFRRWMDCNQDSYLHPVLSNAYHMLRLRGTGSRNLNYIAEPI